MNNVKFWSDSQSVSGMPYVYINGNMIRGDTNITLNNRETHPAIIDRYFKDATLHKNDIFKKDILAWKLLNLENILLEIPIILLLLSDDKVIIVDRSLILDNNEMVQIIK